MIDSETVRGLIAGLERIVTLAGAAILPLYANGCTITRKTDGSPVTEADHAAEAVVLAGLADLTPHIPIVSEEQVAAGFCPDCSGGLWWCVDPLDGTKEFVNRTGEFAVSVGLISGLYPVLGALRVPVQGITYSGGLGLGAWKQIGDIREPIHMRAAPAEGLVAMISRSHRDGAAADTALADRGVTHQISCGSAWKFGLLAEGAADIMIRHGRTCEWDTAGGQAIIEGAGGRVTELDGRRLAYGKPAFGNSAFQVLAG
jgi:3'(2'), 5'-bisphosphate nucleotidase